MLEIINKVNSDINIVQGVSKVTIYFEK